MALWVIALTVLFFNNYTPAKGESAQQRAPQGQMPRLTVPDFDLLNEEKIIALAAAEIPRTTEIQESMFVESAPYIRETLVPQGAIEFKDLNQYLTHFKITEQTLERLRSENVPDAVLAKLSGRKDRRFTKRELDNLTEMLTEREKEQYQSLILKHAHHGYFLLTDLEPGQPLLKSKLHVDRQRLIEDRTLVDKRAMSVQVDSAIAVAGFIKPYSWVDVLVTLNNPQRTKTVLRNVLVLAVDDINERNDNDNKAKEKVSIVTLQIKPEEAEALALASRAGKLHLSLRNPQDTEPVKTRGFTLEKLLALDVPSIPKSRLHKVNVIRGTEQQVKTFKLGTN